MSPRAFWPKRGSNTMKNDKRYVCPRCDYPLVPVHAREGARRRVIALSCPEPYCDHMQLVPRRHAAQVEDDYSSQGSSDVRTAANG